MAAVQVTEVIQLGDARELPFRDRYFGLAFFSPPWDDPQVFAQALPEIQRVLKKRGRIAAIMPNTAKPEMASLILTDRLQTKGESFAIPKPANKVGPRYFSVDEDVVNRVLDMFPWVDRVLDPFCGAGTIVKVARERGLEAYGVDIDPEAVELARRLTA